jgi:hypothetical protein
MPSVALQQVEVVAAAAVVLLLLVLLLPSLRVVLRLALLVLAQLAALHDRRNAQLAPQAQRRVR